MTFVQLIFAVIILLDPSIFTSAQLPTARLPPPALLYPANNSFLEVAVMSESLLGARQECPGGYGYCSSVSLAPFLASCLTVASNSRLW
jgi:hypothetical protein